MVCILPSEVEENIGSFAYDHVRFEESGKPYLKYTEDTSKNRQGGLKGRKVKPKIVYHHANTENPERYFVQLFKKYIKLCP